MKPKSLVSRLFERSAEASGETRDVKAAKYQRQVDAVDHPSGATFTGEQQVESGGRRDSSQRDAGHREIHFSFLSERYEPLIETKEAQGAKDAKLGKKYKKVKKNVGKVLRSSWKCLMLGLYNFALGYSTPISAAATFMPDFHPGRARG